jgi:ascorbate PTS system EIIA or EIIAB component
LTPVVAAQVGVEAGGWREAVRAACGLLHDAGAVDQGYVDACVAMVEEHGPYMVVAPGIALAHARPEDGSRVLGVSVAVLGRPVEFGHPENDPVDVVFAFGSPDSEQHVEMLASLAGGLTEGLADGLRAAPDDTAARDSLTRAIAGG